MKTIQIIIIAFVALEHLYFLIIEMFLWTKPYGMRAFGIKKDFAQESKVLAANQGLYNGFLVAGLLWSLLEKNVDFANTLALFFLSCVAIAGIYGAYSTKKIKLFILQAIPAILGIIAILVF